MPFDRVVSPQGVVWRRCRLLTAHGVPHAFSTRLGGESPAPFDSMNLGLADAPGEADSWERVERNWARLLQATDLHGRTLVRLRQVHGAVVRDADLEPGVVRSTPPFADGDAIVTADRSQVISVRVADCGPVLLADPEAGLVSAVHAGWRGLCAGIVRRAVRRLIERGACADRIVAAIGACIGGDAFEVGDDVRSAMEAQGLAEWVRPGPGGVRWRAELAGAIAAQLAREGVAPERIEVDGGCTVSDPELFSYRRDGARSGRMAALIGL